jgi:uncharacterized membrane protein YphA (DoxX/SURF4 family)
MNEKSIFVLFLSMFVAVSFIVYGLLCLTSKYMKSEFQRYGLAKYKNLTGILEILGGVGILIGLWHRQIFLVSSFGLTILMILGVITRTRIKDSFIQTLPAIVYFIMCVFLTACIFIET